MPRGKKRTHKEFLNELSQKNNSILVLGIYQKNIQPIACRCMVCGYEWTPTPKSLLNGHGCPKCSNNVKLSNEEFLELLKRKNQKSSTFILIGNYDGMDKKIKCECIKCGTEWSPKANDLIRAGTGCPACSGNIKYTHKRFLNDLLDKNKHCSKIEFLSSYRGMTEKIKCKCKECEHIWTPVASSLMQGTGCPYCAKKRIAQSNGKYLEKARSCSPLTKPMSNDDFMRKLKQANHNYDKIDFLTPYLGAKTKIKCICKKCGCEWDANTSSLIKGSGCPRCAHTSTSFMEQFIYKSLLVFLDDKTVNRDKKLIKRELDIVVPSYKFAIEIGSWKWHKDIVKEDLKKKQLCNEKGYKLYIIYDSYNGKSFNDEYVLTYPFDLSNEKNFLSLKKIISKLVSLYDFKLIDDDKWEEIIKYAYNNSQRVSFEEFLRRFERNNKNFKDIEIIGQFRKLAMRLKCKCKNCGHIWEPIAYDLLRRNTGCKICRNKEVSINKSKYKPILEWRHKNPLGNKKQCHEETGISYATVLKWWNYHKK